MSNALVQLDNARKMLAEARTFDDVKKIRDVAEAAKVYAKAARMGRDSQNYAAEISLVASRKAGSLLRTLKRAKPKAQGGRVRNSEYWKTLKESETPYRTAQLWQRLSEVPEDTLKSYVAAVRKTDKGEISAAGLMRASRPKKSKGTNPYSVHITVPLKKAEYRALLTWARACYLPTEFLKCEQHFIRAAVAEIFRQTGMGNPIYEMETIRTALAKWLNSPGATGDLEVEPEPETALSR